MLRILKRYFIPNQDNDFKPHSLRKTSVLVIAGIAVFIFFAATVHNLVLVHTDLLSAVIPKTLVDLANRNRVSNNLAVLTVNPTLEAAAQLKANDMAEKGYFSHVSPDGKTPWYWFKQAGYKFIYAGENLAVNFSDSESVDTAWMNSQAHRENILKGKFTEIGIATASGIYKGQPTVFVVQMFGKPAATLPEKAPIAPAPIKEKVVTAEEIKPEPNQELAVLGDSKGPNPVKEETFISTSDPIEVAMEQNSNVAQADNSQVIKASLFERLITKPSSLVKDIYIALATFVIISLILMIFIEIRKQHTRNIAYGVFLVILIGSLFFIYQQYIYTPVVVL